MACLIKPRIINRKYLKIARDNNEDVDLYSNRFDYYVDVPCGRCVNCVNSYMTSWRNRLMYEFEYMSSDARANSFFVTLTFDPRNYSKIDFADRKTIRKSLSIFKRRFIDRIRKSVGSSPRHWIVSEFGEKFGRLHLHGLFFDVNFDIYNLEDYWKYGIVDFSLMTEDSIKYCTSYVTKGIEDIIVPPDKIQYVFCSPGIGRAYCDDEYNKMYHHPYPGVLNPIMQNSSQFLQAMPRYFRLKLFTDDEREDMSQQFFLESSDDVIPDPPYRIGKRTYVDYTLYLQECIPYILEYKQLYLNKQKITFNGK